MQSAFEQQPTTELPELELAHAYDELQTQFLRLQQNLETIAKRFDIRGVEQTKHSVMTIVYEYDDGKTFRIMADDCRFPHRGHWDFSLHGTYEQDALYIDDIRGEADSGFGSIIMKHLKKKAEEKNIPEIRGQLKERDYDHQDRLVHFYTKHSFSVMLDSSGREGQIKWPAANNFNNSV
ncbi:hypothetical protein ACFO4L_04250 [Bacillus daqingensis]|uniref:GNAT family N-acetyltransferase n=1 Tax=Bacillus daqingensis TaxID=872396 RepID=A0ABV9NU08_9BACI